MKIQLFPITQHLIISIVLPLLQTQIKKKDFLATLLKINLYFLIHLIKGLNPEIQTPD
jgi:hypothetical protein